MAREGRKVRAVLCRRVVDGLHHQAAAGGRHRGQLGQQRVQCRVIRIERNAQALAAILHDERQLPAVEAEVVAGAALRQVFPIQRQPGRRDGVPSAEPETWPRGV